MGNYDAMVASHVTRKVIEAAGVRPENVPHQPSRLLRSNTSYTKNPIFWVQKIPYPLLTPLLDVGAIENLL